tara:strand:+ start:117 stop:263 length:147 start_codon:yes stop_codon:yes gene_type:complete
MKDEDNWNYDEQKYLGLVIENQLRSKAFGVSAVGVIRTPVEVTIAPFF